MAHNAFFVSVENDLGDFVFDTLKTIYPGKVLIYPDAEMYHRYWVEDIIVILRLPTEAPRGKRTAWETCPSEEGASLFENMFGLYAVDESKLFRYARRRGVEKKLRSFIHEKTDIALRLENRNNDNKR